MKKVIFLPSFALLFVLSAWLVAGCGSRTGSVKPPEKESVNIFDAAVSGNSDFIISYIKNGGDVNARNSDGVTPLMLTAYFGRTAAMKILLDNGALINEKDNVNDETALMMAASKGQTDAVRILIDAKANLNARSSDGKTALNYAKSKGYAEIVDLLKKAGAY